MANPIPTEIKDIRKRYKNRVKRKDLFDSTVDLSASQPQTPTMDILLASEAGEDRWRLLDEGYIMDTAGNPYLYVAKGVAQKIYNSVDKDFVGRVNLGHMPYSQFPFTLGTWTKKDLKVVEMGNGRKALDVKLNVDDQSPFIQELRRTKAELGLSIEMPTTMDWTDEGYGATGVPTVIDAKIDAFAIVGDAGNARSGGVSLTVKEGNDMKLADFKKKYLSAKEEPEAEVPDTEESVTLSAQDFAEIKVALDAATAAQEETEVLLTAMDEKITQLEAENAELKGKVETEVELSTVKDMASNVTSWYSKLTSEFSTNLKAKEDKEAIELKVRGKGKKDKVPAYAEMSDDGFGKE